MRSPSSTPPRSTRPRRRRPRSRRRAWRRSKPEKVNRLSHVIVHNGDITADWMYLGDPVCPLCGSTNFCFYTRVCFNWTTARLNANKVSNRFYCRITELWMLMCERQHPNLFEVGHVAHMCSLFFYGRNWSDHPPNKCQLSLGYTNSLYIY